MLNKIKLCYGSEFICLVTDNPVDDNSKWNLISEMERLFNTFNFKLEKDNIKAKADRKTKSFIFYDETAFNKAKVRAQRMGLLPNIQSHDN